MLHETLGRTSTLDFQGLHLDSVSGIAEDLSMGATPQYVVRSAIVVIVVVRRCTVKAFSTGPPRHEHLPMPVSPHDNFAQPTLWEPCGQIARVKVRRVDTCTPRLHSSKISDAMN